MVASNCVFWQVCIAIKVNTGFCLVLLIDFFLNVDLILMREQG